MDILDLGTPRLSWRRLGSLVAHLPREAVTVQRVAGPEAQWGDDEHLAALTVDAVNALIWLTARAHFKDAPKQAPKPIRRPTDPKPAIDPRDIGAKYADVLATLEQLSGAPRGIAAEEV